MKKHPSSYRVRLTNVINYIYDNLDRNLDVNSLAEVACFSPYHFHRLYREMMGETISNTVRRLRLQQAAAILIRTDLSIQRIATAVGYRSVEGFTRAFSKEFILSPAQYRHRKHTGEYHFSDHNTVAMPFSLPNGEIVTMNTPTTTYPVDIEHFSGQTLVGIKHQGDYMAIGSKFEQLSAFAASYELMAAGPRFFGIYYDDPESVPTESLRSMACLTVAPDFVIPEPYQSILEKTEIPAGRCISLLFKGPYAELEQPYQWLYSQWLPEHNYDIADFPAFEEYLNEPRSTPPNELLTMIRCLLVA